MRIRRLGRADYAPTLERMREFTAGRDATTPDELWLLEHPPVYTLGTHADMAHVLAPGNTPVVQVDRGGQVTWHGPGQLVAYLLMDIGRARIGVRDLVCRLETATVGTLAGYGIEAAGRRDAPGVYTSAGAKIASIGLRIRHGRCYHGVAVNVDPDLTAFARINPCGHEGLAVTSVAAEGGPADLDAVAADLVPQLLDELGLAPLSD